MLLGNSRWTKRPKRNKVWSLCPWIFQTILIKCATLWSHVFFDFNRLQASTFQSSLPVESCLNQFKRLRPTFIQKTSLKMAHLKNILKKYILLYKVPHSPLIISLNVFFVGFLWVLLLHCSTPESVHPKTSTRPPGTGFPPGRENDRIESCIESSNNPPWLPGHNPSYLTNHIEIGRWCVADTPRKRGIPVGRLASVRLEERGVFSEVFSENYCPYGSKYLLRRYFNPQIAP